MKRGILLLACLSFTAACAEDSDHSPLEFSVSGDQIVAIGEIDGTTLETFQEVVEDHPGVQTLVLKYIGGSVDDEANTKFSRLVRRMGMTTVVPSDGLVASGGTDLFLAGAVRVIEAGACIGVHSWAAEDFTATDIPRTSSEHDRYLDYYRDIGIDPAFYWFTLEAAPAVGMHWMTSQEANTFGIASASVTGLSSAGVCDIR